MYINKREIMDSLRQQELKFLMRINSAIPVTDSRSSTIFKTELYSDFYTIRELVEEGYMEYIGHQKEYLCLRPINNFRIYINQEIKDLQSGEIITISMSRDSRTEFESWLATQ